MDREAMINEIVYMLNDCNADTLKAIYKALSNIINK